MGQIGLPFLGKLCFFHAGDWGLVGWLVGRLGVVVVVVVVVVFCFVVVVVVVYVYNMLLFDSSVLVHFSSSFTVCSYFPLS